jgi:hypothetical protein
MTNEELIAALRDFPPEADVFVDGLMEWIWVEAVELNEDGDVILSEKGRIRR